MFRRLINRDGKGKSPSPSPSPSPGVPDARSGIGEPSAPIPRPSHEVDEPWGLKLWVAGDDPKIDIVAIHGLNGHRENTWKLNGKIWLRDFLPERIPSARVYTWGYDANTHSRTEISKQLLYDHAINLIQELSLERRLTKTQERPIIFIAHSLGGLVLKSALIHAASTRPGHLEDHKAIFVSTYGILFVGTPHQGGQGVAWGRRLAAVASVFLNTNASLLQHLERDSEFLQSQLDQYLSISDEFVTKFAYETLATPLPTGGSMVVVPKPSAVVPGARDAEAIAIMRNHVDMVRAGSPEDSNYKTLSGHLFLMAEQAGPKVSAKWRIERRTHTNPTQTATQGGPSAPAPAPQSHSQRRAAAADPDDEEEESSGGGGGTSYSLEHMSLLHRATLMGANDMVQELLEAGEDPDSRTADGFTPLHLAASSDNAEGLRLLLAAGADVGARGGHGISPLWLATQEGSARAVAELLQLAGPALDIDQANSTGQTPLMVAAVKGHLGILGMLLDAGADAHRPDARQGWTALHLAAINNQLASVQEILARRPGDRELLLEAASVTGVRPLQCANACRNPAIAAALLDAGADVDAADHNGITTLRQAVQNGDLEMVDLLLARGARTDIPSANGLSLVDTARLLRSDEIVARLRSHHGGE